MQRLFQIVFIDGHEAKPAGNGAQGPLVRGGDEASAWRS